MTLYHVTIRDGPDKKHLKNGGNRVFLQVLYCYGTVLSKLHYGNINFYRMKSVQCYLYTHEQAHTVTCCTDTGTDLNLEWPGGQEMLCLTLRCCVSRDPRWNRLSHMWQEYIGSSSLRWNWNRAKQHVIMMGTLNAHSNDRRHLYTGL
jgi:hypothetical protein